MSFFQWMSLLLFPLLLTACGEQDGPVSERGKPQEPPGQTKIHAKEVVTDELRLNASGGEGHVVTQPRAGGVVSSTPLLDWLRNLPLVWHETPATVTQKRLVPRPGTARLEGTTVVLPGPVDADYAVLMIPDALPLETTWTVLPPAGTAYQGEGMTLEVHGLRPLPVTWQDISLGAGITPPGHLVPEGYYKLLYGTRGWVLVALPPIKVP